MKEYFFENNRYFYKLLEDGNLYRKLKKGKNKRFKKVKPLKYNSNQFSYCGKFHIKKFFYYELYHGVKLKDGETVRFKNKTGDYSKSNLLLRRRNENDPKYFKKESRNILHYNYKNILIGIYKSQYEASINTTYKQRDISYRLKGKYSNKRFRDHSYMIYEGEQLFDRYSGYDQIGVNSIVQYDLEGNFLNRFRNTTEAIKVLDLHDQAESHIIKCCKAKRKVAYGYKWRYSGRYNKKRMRKMVVRYNKDGHPIAVFENRQKAIANLGINKSYVSLILSGKCVSKNYIIKEVCYSTGLTVRKNLRDKV